VKKSRVLRTRVVGGALTCDFDTLIRQSSLTRFESVIAFKDATWLISEYRAQPSLQQVCLDVCLSARARA
jgi:hypothetical protein